MVSFVSLSDIFGNKAAKFRTTIVYNKSYDYLKGIPSQESLVSYWLQPWIESSVLKSLRQLLQAKRRQLGNYSKIIKNPIVKCPFCFLRPSSVTRNNFQIKISANARHASVRFFHLFHNGGSKRPCCPSLTHAPSPSPVQIIQEQESPPASLQEVYRLQHSLFAVEAVYPCPALIMLGRTFGLIGWGGGTKPGLGISLPGHDVHRPWPDRTWTGPGVTPNRT